MQASNRSEKEARIFSRVLYFLWRTIFRQKWPFLYVIADPKNFHSQTNAIIINEMKMKQFWPAVEWKLPVGVLDMNDSVWNRLKLIQFSYSTKRWTIHGQTYELFPFHSFQQNQHYLYCDSYWLLTHLVNTNLFITI